MFNKKAIAALAAGATLVSGLAFAAPAFAAGFSGYGSGTNGDVTKHGTTEQLGDTTQTDSPAVPKKASDMRFGDASKFDEKGIKATDYPAYENPVYNEGYNPEYSKHAGAVEAKNNELVRLYNKKIEKIYACGTADALIEDKAKCVAEMEKEKENFVNNRLPSLSTEDVYGPRDSKNRTVMKSHRPIDGDKAPAKAPAKAAAKAEAKKCASAPLAKTGAAVALAAVAASVLAGMGAALRKIRH
ncbi:hypothetical protein CJ216_04370 [Gardnerella greenwoodii]|uniref:Peptidase n=2 Tax=Gardnerella greenwoodii TaxID=2914925 RepID=A0A2N6RZ52_9BIFI|nr:hypothetical protein [Gardnerella greenwoodii]PMC43303.1 hypothetical protein CJ216_04370 [Gardnerella greenwoodii]